jgi:peptidoglycan/LPS O-acetylase OafA/YrhL
MANFVLQQVHMYSVSQSSNNPTRPHLAFLDGLRALAAISVVFYHLWIKHLAPEIREARGPIPHWLRGATTFDPYLWAQYAVSVFIVLSGYCLMLPVIRDGEIRGGLSGFFARRARRILPPYYAALALAWIVIGVCYRQIQMHPITWDLNLPAFSLGPVVSHLLLIHNLNSKWAYQICGPMWSVPPECQIYLLFPLILLPLWRRFGSGVLITAGVLTGLFLAHLFPSSGLYFTGLFAMGMAAAAAQKPSTPPDPGSDVIQEHRRATRERVPFFIGSLCLAGAVFLATRGLSWSLLHRGIPTSFAGGACAYFLLICSRNHNSNKMTTALRLLEWRPLVWVGTWSYSLYLTHTMGLTAVHIAIRSLSLPLPATLFLIVFAALPLSFCGSYLFHLAFERPFMTAKKKAVVHLAGPAASPSPAAETLSRPPSP